MSVILETKSRFITFFCSFPNKYSCFLQVFLVACQIKENNSINKLVGISKLNFALSFSQLESLEKVSWLFPMVRLSAVKAAACAQNCAESLLPPFCMCPSAKNWEKTCRVMHQECTCDDPHALLLSDLLTTVFLLKDMYWSWAWSRSSRAVISYNRFNCSPRKVNSEVWILLLLTVAALHDMLRETKRVVTPFKLTDFLLHDTNLVCGGSGEMYLLLDNNSALNRGGLGHCAASGTLHGHNFRSWSDFGVFFVSFVFLSALVCWDRILLIFLSLQRSWYRRQIGNVTGLGLLFQSH